MKIAGLVAGLWLGGLLAPGASAQDVALYCFGDEALIRANDSPLPAGDTSRWTKVKAAEGNRCRLESGVEVVVRARQTQGTPFGMGGTSREAVFSLWVDGRKVISRVQHWPHTMSQTRDYTMNHALYSPGAVHLCWYEKGEMDLKKTAGVTCERRKVDLASLQKDPLEPADDAMAGTITFSASRLPSFCESFVTRKGSGPVDPDGLWVSLGRSRPADEIRLGLPGQNVPFENEDVLTFPEGERKPYDTPDQRVARFDLFNKGGPQTVVEFIGTSAPFYGNFLMAYDGLVNNDDLKAFLAATRLYSFNPEKMETNAPEGWTFVSLGDKRYMTHYPVVVSGTTFVMVEPFEHDQQTPVTLLKLFPNGRSETVCVFQMVEPNL